MRAQDHYMQVTTALGILQLVLGAAFATVSDYVVVGGGSAGCALTARLCTQLPDATFALLERAPPRNATQEFSVRAIRNAFEAWFDPSVTEIWQSEPNAALEGRQVPVLSGRTLGGTSAINGAQWTEPARSFAASFGIDGLTEEKADELYACAREQLGVARPPKDLEQTYVRAWLDAAEAAGVATSIEGKFGTVSFEAINALAADAQGRRADSCAAYLQPLIADGGKCADNVKLVQNAQVLKINLAAKRAVGVQYVDAVSGKRTFIKARREVISCAGPYGSPQLLQLSGIGPRALLRASGIKQQADLPVGEGAQGRALSAVAYQYTGVPLAPENNQTLLALPETEARWRAGNGGPFGIASAATDGVYAPPAGGTGRGALTVTTWTSAEQLTGIPANTPLFTTSCANNPTSRATVRINSTDPAVPPEVSLDLLGSNGEEDAMVACLRHMSAIAAQVDPEFGSSQATPPGEVDAAFVRNTTGNALHFVGACSIGRVLDAQLRVKGYHNLRVVDASAMPRIPDGAGPASTVYMLAEWAGEYIAEQALASKDLHSNGKLMGKGKDKNKHNDKDKGRSHSNGKHMGKSKGRSKHKDKGEKQVRAA